ncbi:hypothetical protein LTR84_012058 [Exophiala bonariae]|uniref:Zn(2)-C6 fungal-type domain-containing protein n=1 Tax=Exophiala bonariae TaxID=1690606 RepID=A0AAV9NGC9_9EURO|nr:hypothetical protein LTR84_012058 [Exophiala bonariae]
MKLPACERCRIRKVKCDTYAPKCTGCMRGNAACIIVDPLTNERYTRDGLVQMEQKLRLLEANAVATSPDKVTSDKGIQKGTKIHFVGDGSGLNFFERLSTTARTRLPSLNESPSAVHHPSYNSSAVTPQILPNLDTATLLITHYLSHVQLHHPLLAKCTVSDLLQRGYYSNNAQVSAEDMYRLFMVFAISSVTTYRRGQTTVHPYGYFRAAQRYASQVSMLGGIAGVQNLLLVARFAMYYHIDCSIWDIARFCMRECIALGFHRPPTEPLPPLQEQIQRNVFWDCYVHDRYSSGILGRPYAIAEDDITVELPLEMSEEIISSSPSESLSELKVEDHNLPNGASVFRFVIKLRRIITRISNCFYSSGGHVQHRRRTITDAGRVRVDLHRFLRELECAREHAPVFESPESLYERSEWYDFLVEKDKLTLIRGALAQIPVDGLHPPRELLKESLRCATSVIELYSTMFSNGQITWTRSYFQIMFTSGLSIMYTLSLLKHEKSFRESGDKGAFLRASRALTTACELMKMFVSEMPDAGRFADIFEVLVKRHTGTGSRARPSRAASPTSRDHVAHQLITHSEAPDKPQPPPPQHDINVVSMTAPSRQDEYFDVSIPAADTTGIQVEPMLSAPTGPDQQEDDLAMLDLDLDNFQNWSLFPANTDNMLGQVEAGLGEYVWGTPPDDSLWDQWDFFRGPS